MTASPPNRRETRLRSNRGFSLVEALIALTMLTVGVLAMGGALSATNRAARDSLEATVAEHLLRQKMEELRFAPYASIASGGERVTLDGISFTRRWRVTQDQPTAGLARIEVDVTWSEYSAPLVQPLSQPLTTTLTDPLGTVESVLEPSGRTRTRTLAGFRAR